MTRPQGGLARRGWAVIDSIGFTDGEAVDLRVVRRLARTFGKLSDRDGGTDVWPVRPVSADLRETFSRRIGAAELHTDAAYRPRPEAWVLLFCVRPAEDGGATLLLGSAEAREGLDHSVAAELARPCWRWDPPKVFGGAAGSGLPVLSDDRIRWRYDNLSAGLPASARGAAAEFRSHLDGHPRLTRLRLGTDSALIVDNHRVLHGRTSFSDGRRHLLRVRLERA